MKSFFQFYQEMQGQQQIAAPQQPQFGQTPQIKPPASGQGVSPPVPAPDPAVLQMIQQLGPHAPSIIAKMQKGTTKDTLAAALNQISISSLSNMWQNKDQPPVFTPQQHPQQAQQHPQQAQQHPQQAQQPQAPQQPQMNQQPQ